MKRFAAFVTVVALLAVAAPVLAATNPFMDVPMNSWAYDAVAQLASKGILSGYPDGLYKGRQPMTRYEAASVVARALAYTDMTKASKQDIDMLKRLVIEFKDELDALGVRVDELDKDMALFKRRLGGWRLSGHIRLDAEYRMRSQQLANTAQKADATKRENYPTSMGNIGMSDGRLNIDRFFGEDDKASLRIRLRFRTNGNGEDGSAANEVFTNGHFYARVPFVFDSYLTVGWGGYDDIDKYFSFQPDMTGRYLDGGGWFNDNQMYFMKFEKAFEYGDFNFYVAHPGPGNGGYTPTDVIGGHAWELLTNINFKWNEVFKFGIGAQYLSQNDWTVLDGTAGWNNIFTGWVGVSFNFLQGAALHGMAYFQSKSSDNRNTFYDQSSNAWRVAIDVKQDVLQFTSLFAEYGRIQQWFYTAQGIGYNGALLMSDRDQYRATVDDRIKDLSGIDISIDDISYWKVGATQQWTDQWRTWLFYSNANGKASATLDAGLRQYALGVDYAYNPYTIFSLNYMRFDGLDAGKDNSYSRVRLTTTVSF